MNETLETKNSTIKDILEIVISAILIYLIISIFVIPSNVNQTSMYPTFKDGDLVFATRGYLNGNRYERGQVILFDHEGKVLIKRVIGVPGDKVTIKEGHVYINDKELNEEYLSSNNITYPDMETVVHDDCYFAMGDNRYNSLDSRTFGEVYVKDILGIVHLRVFPSPTTF